YENVPWEKVCTIAWREKSPDTKIVGYQHTVVPQASLNLFTNSRAKNFPMPDKIIASGNIPKQIMEKYGEYEEGFIETACALRYEHISGFERRPRQQTGRLLVALEGVLKANQMIQYVLDQLAGDENFQVTIRTHPVLPWKHYSRRFGHRISAVSNFEISADKDLKSDIEASDAVIYWGSTVSLESLSMGVPVIHYSTGSMLSYDPLFECPYLKWNVSERVQLRDVMNDIYTFDINDFTTFQQKAGDYISNHFHPVSNEKLHKFIL
ncbi:MAG: hypothetical protein KAR20_24330, partial [Candidatus Heimdallarchaeota archaeon]|nr:hypothetical protein [Candidatus Heimdallarchaeota archaeon]